MDGQLEGYEGSTLMANERGTYGTVKTFGEGMLAGAVVLGVGALLLRYAAQAQKAHVEAINLYRPRTG
jgi:hypothetical protein